MDFKNKKGLVFTSIGILILLIIGLLWPRNLEKKASPDWLVWEKLSDRVDLVLQESSESVDAEAKDDALESDLIDFLDTSSDKSTVRFATLALVKLALKSNDLAKVQEYSEKLVSGKEVDYISAIALYNLSSIALENNDEDLALSYLEQLVNSEEYMSTNSLQPEVIYLYATLLQEQDVEKARTLYQSIVDDYGDSIYFNLAKDRLLTIQ